MLIFLLFSLYKTLAHVGAGKDNRGIPLRGDSVCILALTLRPCVTIITSLFGLSFNIFFTLRLKSASCAFFYFGDFFNPRFRLNLYLLSSFIAFLSTTFSLVDDVFCIHLSSRFGDVDATRYLVSPHFLSCLDTCV